MIPGMLPVSILIISCESQDETSKQYASGMAESEKMNGDQDGL